MHLVVIKLLKIDVKHLDMKLISETLKACLLNKQQGPKQKTSDTCYSTAGNRNQDSDYLWFGVLIHWLAIEIQLAVHFGSARLLKNFH